MTHQLTFTVTIVFDGEKGPPMLVSAGSHDSPQLILVMQKLPGRAVVERHLMAALHALGWGRCIEAPRFDGRGRKKLTLSPPTPDYGAEAMAKVEAIANIVAGTPLAKEPA